MKTQMKRMVTVSMVIAGLLCMGSLTHAQQVEEKEWSWRLIPFYGWLTSMSGESGFGRAVGDVDIDFDQIVENLSFAYMGHFEGVWRQTAGFFANGVYMQLDADKDIRGITTKLEYSQTGIEAGAFYRFAAGPNDFDLLGGVRYYNLDIDVAVENIGDASKAADWFDGIGGLRWIVHVTDTLVVSARGDLGFGGSNLAWNVAGLLDWQPWEHFSFMGGYRALGIDYEDDDGKVKFTYDMVIQGPVLGFSIVW